MCSGPSEHIRKEVLSIDLIKTIINRYQVYGRVQGVRMVNSLFFGHVVKCNWRMSFGSIVSLLQQS